MSIVAAGQVADYAELRGGEGRDVFFRPERYRPSDLGPVAVTVEVTIGEELHRPELLDVSRSGVAFVWPSRVPVQVGTIVAELVVRLDQHEAYRGAARVSSLRRAGGDTIAGISFTGGLLDTEAALQLRDVKAWPGGAGSPGLGVRRAPWRVAGQERFKAAVADLRLYLADSEEKLAELESTLPRSVVHGDAGSPARRALVDRVRRELAGDVVACSAELDAALRAASPGERAALREFSLRYLHELLMRVPWMRRARDKPLGYPGDYEVMNHVYGDGFGGATLFDRALGLSFLCTPAALAVRARKDLVKARLAALLDDPATDRERPLRVLSIAAGPAQEIFELLGERRRLARPVEIVLFDQDKRALSYAYGRLRGLAGAGGAHGERARIVYLHDSIKRLLLGADVFGGEGPFDVVYSCGLFDYLQARTAIALARSLYARVAPGGTLYVGNMVPANPSRWFMELHLDWFLVYRETAELLGIGRAAAPGARVELVREETGVNPFVALTRA
jgi:SAM-dependent methyltransferase